MAHTRAAHVAELGERDKAIQRLTEERDAALLAASTSDDGRELIEAQRQIAMLQEEKDRLGEELSKACRDLEIEIAKQASLSERLQAILRTHKSLQQQSAAQAEELDWYKAALEAANSNAAIPSPPPPPPPPAPASTGISSEQLEAEVERRQQLERTLEASREAQRVLEARLYQSEEQLGHAKAALQEGEGAIQEWSRALEKWKAEAVRVQGEMLEVRHALDEAMSSIGCLASDKRRLVDNIQDLIRRTRTAESSLAKTSRELAMVTMAMEKAQDESKAVATEADAKVRTVQESAQRERTVLVSAALRSLNQLRNHLTSTLAGLHVVPEARHEDGNTAWQRWKSQWGVAEAQIVKLVPPPQPPLSISRALPAPRFGSRPGSASASARRKRSVSPDDSLLAAALRDATEKANNTLTSGFTGARPKSASAEVSSKLPSRPMGRGQFQLLPGRLPSPRQ